MNNKWSIEILIKAVPKGRPRSVIINGSIRNLTPKKTREFEKQMRLTLASWWFSKLGNKTISKSNAMSLNITFEFIKPPSVRKRIYPTVKPDLSNLIRSTEDAMSKIVFEDDAQVVEIFAKKKYGLKESIKIEIEIKN